MNINSAAPDKKLPGSPRILIPDLLRILSGILMLLVLFLLLFNDGRLCSSWGIAKNVCLLLPALALLFLFTAVISRCSPKPLKDKRFYLLLGFCFVLIYCAQLYISPHIAVKSGWDVRVIRAHAEALAFDNAPGVDIYYFSTYPNNLMLVYTLALFYRIGMFLYPPAAYAVVLAITAAVVCLSGFLSSLCVYRITRNQPVTVLSVLLNMIMVCLSPWMTIPYTDSLGCFFPVATLFCLLYIKQPQLKYFAAAFISLIGYFYKPTAFIMLIAIVIVKLSWLPFRKPGFKQLLMKAASLALAGICALCLVNWVESLNQSPMEEELRMGPAHYFMMGLNTDTGGGYSESDLFYSESFETVSERRAANLQKAGERLEEMGFGGYLQHLASKLRSCYNDGSFGYGIEGTFYYELLPDDSQAAKWLRSIFYTNEMGTNNKLYRTAIQLLWLMSLAASCLSLLSWKRADETENIAALGILGLNMFMLLFECRARYLFLYTPVFMLIACLGIWRAALNFGERNHE